jgi:hypothetical protein
MEMTPQEIISTVQTFPTDVQMEIVETLQKNLRKTSASTPSEDEIEQILLAKGLISEIPKRIKDKEEETYTPVRVTGKPLSETVLEERE